jgi:hypothetical protein
MVDLIKWTALAIYLVMWLCFVFGNWISVKLLDPEHKDLGRIFMGALLLASLHIFFSILTAWKAVLPFMFKAPYIGVIGVIVSWFFICKFLYGYSWVKAIVATLLPIIVFGAVFAIVYFIAPTFIMDSTVLRLF